MYAMLRGMPHHVDLVFAQATSPADLTPAEVRELAECWMTVANAGGAVGFPR